MVRKRKHTQEHRDGRRRPDQVVCETLQAPADLFERPIPAFIEQQIQSAYQRIQTFQDCWQRPQIEQFVACDYRVVYQMLDWVVEERLPPGRRFLEWGSGFAIVTCLASALGFDAIGIESEEELIQQSFITATAFNEPVQLLHGNFLPEGSESLAGGQPLNSVGHPIAPAYAQIDAELSDFACVFSYPWPGEDWFHCDVFDRYAAAGAIHCLFLGPYEIMVRRKWG